MQQGVPNPMTNPNELQSRDWRWLFTFAFALIVIWTGLHRCIEASAFKPNAFYFCLVTGLIGIAAGFMFWLGKNKTARLLGLLSAGFVFGYYLFTFISSPENDANHRVALAIMAALVELIVVTLPERQAK